MNYLLRLLIVTGIALVMQLWASDASQASARKEVTNDNFSEGGTTTGDSPIMTTRGDWNTQAGSFCGKNGQRYTFTFPAGATTSRLWGTDLYTYDSSIATAAVHAGLITPQRGGTVAIEIRPAASSY